MRNIEELLDIYANGGVLGEAYRADCPFCHGKLDWYLHGKRIFCTKCGIVWAEPDEQGAIIR